MPRRQDTIAILDDDSDRIDEMRRCLLARVHEYEVMCFDNAPDIIEWLQGHLEATALICLDHDLGPNRHRDGDVFDPGTGRDVADYFGLPDAHLPGSRPHDKQPGRPRNGACPDRRGLAVLRVRLTTTWNRFGRRGFLMSWQCYPLGNRAGLAWFGCRNSCRFGGRQELLRHRLQFRRV